MRFAAKSKCLENALLFDPGDPVSNKRPSNGVPN